MTIIQVGDFGWYPELIKERLPELPWPLYAIDGNHEYHPMLRGMDEVTEVKKNLFFVPRGKVLEIDGYKIGFMGGAHSVDIAWRRKDIDWWVDEEVTDENIAKLIDKKVDILVTHTPPTGFIMRNFGPINKNSWGLKPDWEDKSSLKIEKLWGEMGMPPLICGHMHKPVIDGQIKLLDINEMFFLKPGMNPVDWYQASADNRSKK
jgi:Icc-related predicted phosphoesterase